MSNIDSITYQDAKDITPSDTADIGPYAALEAKTTAGLVQVMTLGGTILTVYLPLGLIKPLAVRRVYNTNLGAAGIVGYIAPPYKPTNKGVGGT